MWGKMSQTHKQGVRPSLIQYDILNIELKLNAYEIYVNIYVQ